MIRDGWFVAQGLVVDREGRPVPGVSVKARSYSAVTDRHGCFFVSEITSPDKHAMPFSVDAVGSKNFVGTVAAPGSLRVRVVLGDLASDTDTLVETSPAPEALLSCEPPRMAMWHNDSPEEAAGSTRITTLSELSKHLGEYPCRNGLLESPVLRTALQSVLANDYERYLEYVDVPDAALSLSVARGFSWMSRGCITGRAGARRSFLSNRSPSASMCCGSAGTTAKGRQRVYGPQPVPLDVSTLIVDELNSSRGDVESFSWRDGAVHFEARKDRPLSILERPQPLAEARSSLQVPFGHFTPCPIPDKPPTTVREALGPLADRVVIHHYDKSRWSALDAVARVVNQIVDAVPKNGRLYRTPVSSEHVRPLIAGLVEFKGLSVWPIEFAPGYVHLTGEDGCEWWGRYPPPSGR
jgi:hypothetical protein